MDDGLVVNDGEQGKRFCRTTPKGVEYLAVLSMMCDLLQAETRAPEI